MNYIRHLNAFFTYVKYDNRLTASHVSLYLALFQYWNFNRFQNPFPIYRTDIMNLCKIGSKNTYHKCLKELHRYKYIYYHPAPYKYQPVKISMVRLDKPTASPPEQLGLFPPLEEVARSAGGGTSIKNDTSHVPNLTAASPDNETNHVPNPGHLIKQSNNKQERETPTPKIFEKNKKIHSTVNEMAGVSNLIHMPSQKEVENYFSELKYSREEAIKFFNHYKALEWKLQGRTPILDWKPLVEKWMQNTKRWEEKKQLSAGDPNKDLQYLFDSFLEGKNIFQYILPQHFDHFNLSLTDEILQQARTQRIRQVSGTNQYSLDQLWQAYLTNDTNNELIERDYPNLIAFAKRLAVINHFQILKNRSQ